MIRNTTTTLSKDGVENPHLTLDIEHGIISLNLNSFKIFDLLANREAVVGIINKKLNELVQKYLEKAASREKERNQTLPGDER